MTRMCALSIALATGLLAGGHAHGSEVGDRLSQCLTGSVTGTDRTTLVRWMFAAVALHPDLQGLAAVAPERRETIEREAAAVFERLIARDCAAQSRDVIAQEGAEGFGKAFETLGSVAMEGFMGHPDVQRGVNGVAARIDSQDVLRALLAR